MKSYQTGLKAALVEKCWLAASIVTWNLGLAVGLDFFQLLVQSVFLNVRNRRIFRKL